MKKFIFSTFFLLVIGALIGGGFAYYKINDFLSTAPSSEENAQIVVVDIVPGSNLTQVADLLFEKGLITEVLPFKLLARYQEVDTNLQAGRFEFSTHWLPQEVIAHLVSGAPVYYRLTIREGLPWWEVGRLLEEEGYATYDDFKAIIHDPEFLAHYGIPFHNAEGFLYPDTYFLPRPDEMSEASARSVAGRLIDTFWTKTRAFWQTIEPERNYPTKDTLERYLTLASIIEKETGISSERARVSGVYTNRIRINMLLQADPTVAYGMGEDFEPPLLRSHLDNANNMYNTYQHGGLPPGPICSPSLASLEAAFNPEEHDYFYFVATGTDGSHYFAKTLSEHNANVQRYRATQN